MNVQKAKTATLRGPREWRHSQAFNLLRQGGEGGQSEEKGRKEGEWRRGRERGRGRKGGGRRKGEREWEDRQTDTDSVASDTHCLAFLPQQAQDHSWLQAPLWSVLTHSFCYPTPTLTTGTLWAAWANSLGSIFSRNEAQFPSA